MHPPRNLEHEADRATTDSERTARHSDQENLGEDSTTDTESQTAKADNRIGGGPPEKAADGDDETLVTWDGPQDPENPKNWSLKKKWIITIVVSLFTFISPVSSSMVAPALSALAADLGVKTTIEEQLTLSIFVLAYGIGPLVFGPLSESFGRVKILMLSNLFYLAWNMGCGFAQNEAEMLVFRFMAGIGGSAPLAIGGGVLR